MSGLKFGFQLETLLITLCLFWFISVNGLISLFSAADIRLIRLLSIIVGSWSVTAAFAVIAFVINRDYCDTQRCMVVVDCHRIMAM